MESNQSPHEKFMCSVCGKNCGSKKSQLRHISYCKRVKSRGGVRSRKRACSACTKSKTQCDLIHPSCSRCLKKSLGCVYEGPHFPRGKNLESEVGNHTDTGANQIEEASLISSSSQDNTAPVLPDIHEASMVSNPLQISGVTTDGTMNLELPNENWNLDTEDCFPEHLYVSVFSTPTQYSARLLPIEPSPIFASYQPKNSGSFYRLYDQPIPTAPKAFALRRPSNNQFSLNRSYILCTLPTYPSMLLPSNDDGLPPFIHPHFSSRKALPAPLATCVTIIQWISMKNKDNVLFIWGCIKMEIDRICIQYTTYNREDSVAALQAITIYLLLRISEDNEKATNFDVPLISAMIKLSIHVIHLAEDLQNEGALSWKEWALAESTRRTIIILFFIDLFFDISSSVHEYRCDENRLKQMTLPCSRKLWRATTNEAWEDECANSMRGIQLMYGDLINSRNRPEDRRLDGWLSQLDDFGMLVLAAASLAS
ncbi:uncharacterized protein EAE97_010183 [Botrytis byssoidea]|uniref:Zn(2)-C6 fungal-type domain-containing protein n=1 Tax=Botrytis byssoidea TaxID=139641 RepID=A0A9P5LVS6_9HELO|nr:uncharacterized protein EAE97_010183 [Botrytis byssoidea]KAF7926674.1 hypothetical protein EAE97_010183 [Botrytis byssoidea]